MPDQQNRYSYSVVGLVKASVRPNREPTRCLPSLAGLVVAIDVLDLFRTVDTWVTKVQSHEQAMVVWFSCLRMLRASTNRGNALLDGGKRSDVK